MKKGLDSFVRVSTIALLAAGISASVHAQAAPAANGAATGGDIVVTAQKREQHLIDVPISITAITGDTLAKRGASTIEDLQYAVPGVSITEFSPGQQRVQIRGISVYSGLPTVGTYLDEMPLNLELNQSGQDVRLLDVDRVEVLRGPQGTLYGQGAMGGTIRYITKGVDLKRISASASGEVGAVNSGGTDWKGEAMINVPLVADRIGVRVAGGYQHFGGWIDNPTLGEKNTNSGHALTLRGKLAFVITDDFKLTLTGQHQNLKIGAQNLSDADQQIGAPLDLPFSSKADLANALATYDFGPVTLLSSTSYLHRTDDSGQDLTAVFGPYVPLLTGLPSSAVRSIGEFSRSTNRVFTEELRLSSNGNSRFGWTVGGFYRQSHTAANGTSVVTPNVLPSFLTLLATSGTSPDESRSWAAFGEGSYRITDTLTALVGLRYFHDERAQDSVSTVLGTPTIDIGRASFHSTSPRFNLSWQPGKQINIYANVAKGFRSGGFNLTSTGAGLGVVPATYAPDTLWTYEAGAKLQSADRAWLIELAGYRNVWTHVQTTTNLLGLPTGFTTNTGKITGWGADGSLSYSPIRSLTLALTGGWNDMAYKSNSAEHLIGDRADYVPRFTGSASAEYRFAITRMPSFVRVDYQHGDSFQVFLRNFQLAPARSDAQNIVNARIGISGKWWDGAIFVRNLTNKDSVLYPAFAALIYPARLEPRVIGASFGIKY
jgi:iron complex outermembrane receptor protein